MPAKRVTRDPNDPAFPHGTNAGYDRGCHCTRCRTARTLREKQTKHDRDSGRPRRSVVDAALTRHLQDLMEVPYVTAAGIARAAAPASGRDAESLEQAVGAVLRGRAQFIASRSKAALLAVTADDALGRAERLDVRRTTQMLRSLTAYGYPLIDLSRRLGYQSVGSIRGPLGVCGYVTADTYARVEALYRELENTPGPSRRTAMIARRRGWHPPAAYDDEGNLIPEAVRVEEPEQDIERRDRDRIETLVLIGEGRTRVEICDLRGFSERAVTRATRAVGVQEELVPSGLPASRGGDRRHQRVLTEHSLRVIAEARRAWLRVQCGADAVEEWDALVAWANAQREQESEQVAA